MFSWRVAKLINITKALGSPTLFSTLCPQKSLVINISHSMEHNAGECVSVFSCSVMSDSVTLWPAAHQASLSVGFSRQEYRGSLPFPPPEDLPDPGIELASPALQVDSLPLSHWGSCFREYLCIKYQMICFI